jgi:hypothetical protein
LKSIVLDEGGLHGMQPPILRQSFDRCNFVTLVHDREAQAGIDAASVHQHRAGAALAVVAAFFCSGQLQALTQRVQQSHPRFHGEGVFFIVDRKADRERSEPGVARFADLRGERGWEKDGSPDGGPDEFPARYLRALICHVDLLSDFLFRKNDSTAVRLPC